MKRSPWIGIASLAISAVASMLASLAQAAHDHGAMSHDLPAGPDKARVERYCTACHPIQRVLNAGGTTAGWKDRIRRMQRWGARIPADELNGLADYLAGALPPRPRTLPGLLAESASSALQEIRIQVIQTTLRYAARVSSPREVVIVGDSAELRQLGVGQRVRLFAPQQRGNFTSAVISYRSAAGALVVRPVVDLQVGTLLVAEIPVRLGRDLAVANDALIPDGSGFRVLVQDAAGEYASRPVRLGYSGDQLSQVVAGLQAGEQVVSLGTFFIDAEQSMEAMP